MWTTINIAMQPASHLSGMASHDGQQQSEDHQTTPECVTICGGASLTDLAYRSNGVDAFVVVSLGMSAIASPPGRQIGPAERPPKLV